MSDTLTLLSTRPPPPPPPPVMPPSDEERPCWMSRAWIVRPVGGPRRTMSFPRVGSEPARPETVRCLSAMAARWATSSAKPGPRLARNLLTNCSALASVFTVAFHSTRSAFVMKQPCGEFGQFLYLFRPAAKSAGATRQTTASKSRFRFMVQWSLVFGGCEARRGGGFENLIELRRDGTVADSVAAVAGVDFEDDQQRLGRLTGQFVGRVRERVIAHRADGHRRLVRGIDHVGDARALVAEVSAHALAERAARAGAAAGHAAEGAAAAALNFMRRGDVEGRGRPEEDDHLPAQRARAGELADGEVLVGRLRALGHFVGKAGAAAGEELLHELLGVGLGLDVRFPLRALRAGHEIALRRRRPIFVLAEPTRHERGDDKQRHDCNEWQETARRHM